MKNVERLLALRGRFAKTRSLWKLMGTSVAVIALLAAATSLKAPRVQAGDGDDEESNESRIKIGLEVAPFDLDVKGKDRALVGLGSYIVNVTAGCNGCHSAGPRTQFAAGGNPYFGQKEQINLATYLGGGRDFGALDAGGLSAHIISRNLTPDKTGLPEGGRSLEQFRHILRTGADLDHLHPTCTGALNPGCVPPPFKGDLLQVMPWPDFKNLTDHDIDAIYEYLKTVPCIAGPPAPSPLHNDCT